MERDSVTSCYCLDCDANCSCYCFKWRWSCTSSVQTKLTHYRNLSSDILAFLELLSMFYYIFQDGKDIMQYCETSLTVTSIHFRRSVYFIEDNITFWIIIKFFYVLHSFNHTATIGRWFSFINGLVFIRKAIKLRFKVDDSTIKIKTKDLDAEIGGVCGKTDG